MSAVGFRFVWPNQHLLPDDADGAAMRSSSRRSDGLARSGHTAIAWAAPSATSRVGTSWPRASPRGDIDPVLPMGRAMDKALAYAISALIVGFGVWIFIVDLSSAASTLCAVTALIPIMIGLLSAFGPK